MMALSKADLAREALELSLEVRENAGEDYNSPINVFDLCGKLSPSVRVRFVAWSMEGCYHRSDRPLILISALRPLGRRVFNCAHELGHHAVGDGFSIDDLQSEDAIFQAKTPKERFADTFAGFLLMPKLGVRRAFTVRAWQIASATPEQCYVVACHFGVGYTTLVNHLAYGLREVSDAKSRDLAKVRLPKIRRQFIGSDCAERLLVIDQNYEMPTVDCEVGTHLYLPTGAESERDELRHECDLPDGRLFLATSPGLRRVVADDGRAVMVRVCPHRYSGLSQYRHLPEVREALDDSLEANGFDQVHTVANTIFPQSLWKRANGDRQKLYAEYKWYLPDYVAMAPTKNRAGLYLARLIGYGIVAKTGEPEKHIPQSRLKEGGNQLEFIIKHCQPGVRRAMLQAAIYDPVRDQDAAAQKAFPCLQHVTFVPHSESKTLALNAFYATQQLFVKAYGIWLGLSRLGMFVASQTGLRFATMNCFAGIEKMDSKMRPKAGPELQRLRAAAADAIKTESLEPVLN